MVKFRQSFQFAISAISFTFMFSACNLNYESFNFLNPSSPIVNSTPSPSPSGVVNTVLSIPQGQATLHAFNESPGFLLGENPSGDLLLSGNTLYGMTQNGGIGGYGTIFRVGIDGSNPTLIYAFTNGNDGANPAGSLIQSGSTLYGMTYTGGSDGSGTVFSVATNGSNFTSLYSFTNGADGANPMGSLLLVGTTLYGMTSSDGISGDGVIFSIDTSGINFTVIHSFTGRPDGASPSGNLISANGVLYGATVAGYSGTTQPGSEIAGTIFSMNPDGSNFTILHTFTDDGGPTSPTGNLVLSGSTLYGTTTSGGSNPSIFKLGIDGSNFSVLYTLSDVPHGNLTLSGNLLYGTTRQGGSSGAGSIFSAAVDGSQLTSLYSLNGTTDGNTLYGTPIINGNHLYGMSSSGALGNGGTVFDLNLSNSSFTVTLVFGVVEGATPEGDLLLVGDNFYGTTNSDGLTGFGTIFSMRTDGSHFKTLYFLNGATDGQYPEGSLIVSGSTLYGMTSQGGAAGAGTAFSIGMDGSNFTVLHTFSGVDGYFPLGSLTLVGNTLYGMSIQGGTSNVGAIFSFNTDGSNFQSLYSFTGGADGGYPVGSLIASNNVLYGTTQGGGTNSYGNVFSFAINTSTLTSVYSFNNGVDGAYPAGTLLLSGNTLYGTTYQGGAAGYGTVFKIQTDGSNLATLYSFTNGNDGGNPTGSLVMKENTLYGVCPSGGANNDGSIFSVGIDGSNFTSLYSFTAIADGSTPNGSLILSGNALLGTAANNGAFNGGVVFEFGL